MLHKLYLKQVEAWKERFEKPISDEVHRHLNSPTSKNVYYDNTELLSSRHKDTIELLEAIEKELVTKVKGKFGVEQMIALAEFLRDLEEQLKLIKKEI